MGINCSTIHGDSDSHAEKASKTSVQTPSETVRIPRRAYSSGTMADDHRRPPPPAPPTPPIPPQDGRNLGPSLTTQSGAQYSILAALDTAIDRRLKDPSHKVDIRYSSEKEYFDQRDSLQTREAALSYDYSCTIKASRVERRANLVLQAVIKRDNKIVYETAGARTGYGGQQHPRFFGDHYLSNVHLIEKTWLFEIAHKMPKGAHLHIHFNANLLPNVLVDIAKTMEHMYIMSNVPLMTEKGDASGFNSCKISFSIISPKNVAEKRSLKGTQSLFDLDYMPKEPMAFKEFCNKFQRFYNKAHGKDEDDDTVTVDKWLYNKLVFQEEETYNLLQTAEG